MEAYGPNTFFSAFLPLLVSWKCHQSNKAMIHGTKERNTIIAGLLLFLVGTVLIICTLPFFSHTRQEVELVPRSEVIINSTFNIHQLEDKMLTFQLSIGQSIIILATSNKNVSCSIANFTQTDDAIQPDKLDVLYFFQNDTTTINKTWSPPNRVPEPGKYYLVFLARDALPDSPVQVYVNATKTWTDIQLKEVVAEDRVSMLDQNYGYIGSAMVILGIAAIRIAVIRNRRSK